MSAALTVNEMVTQVREGSDETNLGSISNDFIVSALNRALEYAADALVRSYPEPLITYDIIPLVPGQKIYTMPEGIFEDRVEKVEVFYNVGFLDLVRLSYRELALVERTTQTARPYNYALFGRYMQVLPTPSSTFQLRIWYVKEPETIVPQKYRVLASSATTSVAIDPTVTQLTMANPDTSVYASYLNVIDKDTGIVKGTVQVDSVSSSTLTIKPVPERAEVHNKTVAGSFPTDMADGDWLCDATGSCVPELRQPFLNFAIEYAIAKIRHKFAENSKQEREMLDQFEKQVVRTWVKREQSSRIKNRNRRYLSR
jgi:hypothetical protein